MIGGAPLLSGTPRGPSYSPGLTIVTQLPAWPTGFTAWFTAHIINGIARGLLPWYELHPLPPLYRSGVVFAQEPNHGHGWEDFSNPWQAYARGWVDCDDATIWRLVELLYQGEDVTAEGGDHTRADWKGSEIHVQLRRADGDLEDPVMRIPWYTPQLAARMVA